jgi:hypothetical protein
VCGEGESELKPIAVDEFPECLKEARPFVTIAIPDRVRTLERTRILPEVLLQEFVRFNTEELQDH